MKYNNIILCLFIFFMGSVLNAQQEDAHIKKITGDINKEWLHTVVKSIPAQQVEWTAKKVHGFDATSSLARKQTVLSKPWTFYSNDFESGTSKGKQVSFPHKFERNRKYNSAWYISKLDIESVGDKQYFLKLNRIQLFSKVFVNGEDFGNHIGSYTPFEFDITNALKPGDNVIAIFVYDQNAAVDGDKLITQVSNSRLRENQSGFRLPGGIDDAPIIEVMEKANLRDVFVKTSTRNKEMEIEFELGTNANVSSDSKLSFELLKWPNGEKVDLDIPSIKLPKSVTGVQSCKVKWEDADLWSPDHPNLYVLRTILKNGKNKDVLETRFGFREFWVEGKSFMLNGSPIRLRGESNYHPQRNNVDFHREVFNMHKDVFDANACRIHAFMPHGDIIKGADEAGMLLIDQSAVWSVNGQLYAKGGESLLKNLKQEFEEWVRRDRNSPSVVIWDVENEMLRFNYEMHLPWTTKLSGFIEPFDNTRPYNLSAAGWYSEDQEMVSIHMQDHYARIMSDWKNKGTTPLIMGEFWIGARADQRLPSAPELKTAHQRFVEEAKSYEENMLEMRHFGVSAVMPFRTSILGLKQVPHTTVGYEFTAPNTLVKEKRSKDVLQKIKHALQAETVFFWPRERYAATKKPFQREVVICNDGETANTFEVSWKWDNQPAKTKTFTLEPAAQERFVINEETPNRTTKLIATLSRDNKVISADTLRIIPIVPLEKKSVKNIQVFKDQDLAKTLSGAGFEAFANDDIPYIEDDVLWIIPEHANNRELDLIKDDILNYLDNGGNILCLKQDQAPTWFPVKLQFFNASLTHLHTYEGMGWTGLNKDLRYAKYATILAASHPVFSGIDSHALHLWDKFDGRVADDAYIRPSKVNKYEQGNWRPLAGSAMNAHVSLAEIFYGKGTMLACQLHVIKNLDNVQSKRLFTNMLNYLSERTPEALNHKVLVKGKLTSTDIMDISGADNTVFDGPRARNNDLMIATEGTALSEIKDWAELGGKVIVLSENVSSKFDGVSISDDNNTSYIGSKVGANPMVSGISSAILAGSLIKSYFNTIPSDAKILIQAFRGTRFWDKLKEAGPVMISIPHGNGEIILSTINIEKTARSTTRELLGLILTNSGVHIPYLKSSLDEISIKKTVPITIDGQLNEWLDDMNDRFVSPYVHAQPIRLTSESIIEGPTRFDLNLSAINYFLWNEKALHIAGVVFTEEKSSVSSISYGKPKEYKQEILYNKDIIEISYKDNVAKVSVNGKVSKNILIENGQLSSKEMTDASTLQFSFIGGGGDVNTVESLVGETFEVLIPWELLTSKPSDVTSKAMLSIKSKDSKLQVPFSATTQNKETWLEMNLSKKGK